MKRAVLAAVSSAALCSAPIAVAQDGSGGQRLQLSLPDNIGTLEFDEHHEFEDPAMGVSVAYRGRGQILTIYFYNAGLRGIPDGIDNEVVLEHFEQVKGDVTHAEAYQEVNFRREGVTRLVERPGAHQVLEAEFRIVRKDGPTVHSYLMLTGASGLFVKVRFSVGEGAELEATANRNAILLALHDLLPTIRRMDNPEEGSR